MSVSNIALQNQISSLAVKVTRLQKSICCFEGGGEVLNTPLTGFIVGPDEPVTSTDTISSGLEKLQGQIDNLSGPVNTIYNADDTTSGNRIVTLGGNLTFNGAGSYVILHQLSNGGNTARLRLDTTATNHIAKLECAASLGGIGTIYGIEANGGFVNIYRNIAGSQLNFLRFDAQNGTVALPLIPNATSLATDANGVIMEGATIFSGSALPGDISSYAEGSLFIID